MRVLSGNAVVAEAVKQVEPDVVVSYPVTPATPILENLASFISDGQLDAEFLNMESDYSSLSACIGAAAAGGRVFTATASQGLAFMHESLFIASSFRLPIVMVVTNRALSAPINIQADHSDSMAQRDSGWIQLYSENAQEAYDNIIQAFKIAEHSEVKTPVMVGLDGFITSHTMTNVLVEETRDIKDFVGTCTPDYSLLNHEKPVTIGSLAPSEFYFEQKVNQRQGIENARAVIKDVGKEFGDRFGRYYGYFEPYKLDDAEYALLLMNSAAGTAKEAVDEARSNGEKVGLLKLRVFRPFPARELRESLAHLKAVAVMDRVLIPGASGGPLFNETRSSLYDLEKKPRVFPYVYGVGGRDITISRFRAVLQDMQQKSGEESVLHEEPVFIDLRDPLLEAPAEETA